MKRKKNSYKKSGVNIETADKFTRYIAKHSKQTFKNKKNRFNKNNIGEFASVFDIKNLKIKDPLLVSSTDGVGTKLELAQQYQAHFGVGIDLVAMCVNDVLTSAAEPLFFLDYIATGSLGPEAMGWWPNSVDELK